MTTRVRTRQDVLGTLESMRDRFRALGVGRIGVFGSFARDEATDESDVDILVEFAPAQKTFEHFMELAFLLEDTLDRRVELLTPDSLSPYLGPHILGEVQYVNVAA